MTVLEEDTRDALAEAFNMALGEASEQFAELMNEEIELTVPSVELVSRRALVITLEGDASTAQRASLCRIAQRFACPSREIDTTALLLFPEAGSLEIVRYMLGESVADDKLNELEQDALAEVGNIIINSCMNSLAHIFDREMTGSLPEVKIGPAAELLTHAGPQDDSVLLARIGMRMATRKISGHVIFMMDLPSLQVSIGLIRRFFGLSEEAA